MKQIIIGLASDHAGYKLKEAIKNYLLSKGYEIHDFGCDGEQPVDYPDYAHPLANSVESKQCTCGIAVCGSGNGINMTVNKHSGIRSGLCWNEEITRLARSHNDINICALPGRFIDEQLAIRIVDLFLSVPFEQGRHINRINKIPITK